MSISFSKEIILEAVKAVLAEEINQIDPINPMKSKKDLKDKARKQNKLTPELEKAIDNAAPKTVVNIEEDDHLNPNDESDMAKVQLYATAKYAIELLRMIQDGEQLDAWVQAKITKAADYIDAVKHYLEGEEYLAGTEAPGMEDEPVEEPIEEPVDEKMDPVGQEDEDINNDGKVDKTDKYLKNRRVKIGKAIAQHKK